MKKHQYYHNIKFTLDEKSGYYQNSTIHKSLHRFVWEENNGVIPKGYEIHHIDFNKSNNTNYKFIATSNENWLNEMEKYKNNLKNNIKYQFIEENVQNIEYDDIIDVFNKKKIEES